MLMARQDVRPQVNVRMVRVWFVRVAHVHAFIHNIGIK
jgi:hypothetical protein